MTGGGTKNRAYVQIMADVIGRPVTLLEIRECTVLGAAILGAVGAGYFVDINSAVDAMVTVETVIEPNQDLRSLYDELFAVFKEAYEKSAGAGVYQRFYDYQRTWF